MMIKKHKKKHADVFRRQKANHIEANTKKSDTKRNQSNAEKKKTTHHIKCRIYFSLVRNRFSADPKWKQTRYLIKLSSNVTFLLLTDI